MPALTRAKKATLEALSAPELPPVITDPNPLPIPHPQPSRASDRAQNADPHQLGLQQPPQQRWINQPPSISQMQVETATDEAYSVMTQIESKWSLGVPTLETSQQDIDRYPGIAEEVLRAWEPRGALRVEMTISPEHNLLSVLYILPEGTEIRYITPQNVWAHTLRHDGNGLVSVEAEPTPMTELPTLAKAMMGGRAVNKHAEFSLQMQELLSRAAGLHDRHEFQILEVKSFKGTHSPRSRVWVKAINSAPKCPGCGSGLATDTATCESALEINMEKHYQTATIKCLRAKTRMKPLRLPDGLVTYLFKDMPPSEYRSESQWTRPSPVIEEPDPHQEPASMPGPIPTEEIASEDPPAPHSLTVVSYNSDGLLKNRVAELLIYLRNINADVVLLQDTGKLNWSQNELLAQGWAFHRHKKCAILYKVATAGKAICKTKTGNTKDPKIWKSHKFSSMAITLDTTQGPLLIATAYLPPGVDKLPKGHSTRKQVADQHLELARLASRCKFRILGMDANETTDRKARMQHRGNGKMTYSGTSNEPGIEHSCMASYDGVMTDALRHKAIQDGRDPSDYPLPKDSTHEQPGQKSSDITKIQSKIDYILASHNLLARMSYCDIDSRPAHWTETGQKRTNYHCALSITLDWEDMWPTDDTPPDASILRGFTLDATPNYAALTPGKQAAIARRVHQSLFSRWGRIRGIWRKGKSDKATQRDTLTNILKSEFLRAAKSVLGIRKPKKNVESPDAIWNDALWDELETIVSRALGKTIEAYGPNGMPSLEHGRIIEIRSELHAKEIYLPHDRTGWLKWWDRRDYHRAQATMDRESLVLTDRMATHNPKKFFSQATKPLASSRIAALRRDGRIITSDEGIEDELHSYLERVADASERPPAAPDPKRNRKRRRHNPRPLNLGLMDQIGREELLRALRTLDNTSAAGYDGISPALLKIVTSCTWQERENKTDADRRQDAIHKKFSTFCIEERNQLIEDHKKDPKNKGPPPPPITENLIPPETNANSILTTQEPNLAFTLVRRVLNLSLETGDIPEFEKLGIITGLPKSDGLVNDTDDMRPITVGPAFNRLLHKILADRLSAAVVKHKLIDQAQFAFLPGGDIHEPISTATACYRNRTQNGGGCYAIYYDISKAYDTIHWSSIKTAMERIKLDPKFINFVMTVLDGSEVAMRTNVPGRITRKVCLEKSIKQGCPLAPLLFIIVMDEMHAALRESGLGYTPKGGPNIGSRGYCDDTWIVADSPDKLIKMNKEIIYPFFAKHGLLINETKTKVTGRNSDGTPFETRICWPASGKPFETVCPTKPIRYLGAHITLDLDWTPQVNKLQALVYTTAAHVDSGRLSLLQGISITKYVTGPRMEIGMRHAHIPRKLLRKWDKVLMSSLCKSAGITDGTVHATGTAASFKITPLEDLYDTVKLAYAMELLTRYSELKKLYQNTLKDTLDQIASCMENTEGLPRPEELSRTCETTKWPSMLDALVASASRGLWILPNQGKNGSRTKEKQPAKSCKGNGITKFSLFKGIRVPTRDTHDLWGQSFDKITALRTTLQKPDPPPYEVVEIASKECYRTLKTYHCPGCPSSVGKTREKCTLGDAMIHNLERSKCKDCQPLWLALERKVSHLIHAQICTDGSTYDGKPSAAAFVFLEDGAHTRELWGVPGYCWQLTVENNYVAEMAAIHKALRSVPVNVNLTIHTDSKSAIDSIDSALRCPTGLNMLRRGARPHLLAIIRAWRAREKTGGTTSIQHVRAHTGGRDLISVGNACADRLAKWMALQPTDTKSENSRLNLMQGDHPFVLMVSKPTDALGTTATRHELSCKTEAVHGDVRKECKTQLQTLLQHTLARRDKRGELMRNHQKPLLNIINQIHAELKCSAGMALILQSVNQITIKERDGATYNHKQCDRCGTKAPLSIEHRLHDCPCGTSTLNAMDDTLSWYTDIPADTEERGPCPSPLRDRVWTCKEAITSIMSSGPGTPEATIVGNNLRFRHKHYQEGIKLSNIGATGSLRNYALMLTLTESKIPVKQTQPNANDHDGNVEKSNEKAPGGMPPPVSERDEAKHDSEPHPKIGDHAGETPPKQPRTYREPTKTAEHDEKSNATAREGTKHTSSPRPVAEESASEIPPKQPGTHIEPSKAPEQGGPEQLRATPATRTGKPGHHESSRGQTTHAASATSDAATTAADANPASPDASSAAVTDAHTDTAQPKQNNHITPANTEAAGLEWGNPNLGSNPNKRKYKAKLAECLRHVKAKYGSLDKAPPGHKSILTKHAKQCQSRIIDCDSGPILIPTGTNPEDKEQTARLHRRPTTQKPPDRNAGTRPSTLKERAKRFRSPHPEIVDNVNEIPPKRPRIHIRLTKTSEQAALDQSKAISTLQTRNFEQFRNNHKQTTRAANAASEAATAAADANSAATAAAFAAASVARDSTDQQKRNNQIPPGNIRADGQQLGNPNLGSNPDKRKYRTKLAECVRRVRTRYGSIDKAPPKIKSMLTEHAKNCQSRIIDYDSEPKLTFAGTNLEGKEQTVRLHISFMIQDLSDQNARTRAPILRQASRIILRTYSDLYYNVLSAKSPWEDCWRARHPGDVLAGAVESKTEIDFMQNRYTWISMRNAKEDQQNDLAQATKAIQNSDKPARAVLLLNDDEDTRKILAFKTKGVHKYVLIEADCKTTPFLTSDNHAMLDPDSDMTLKPPSKPIMIAVIENNEAPTYNTNDLLNMLSGLEGIRVLPQQRHMLSSPDTEEWPVEEQLKPRHHPLLRQSQMWYKPQRYNVPNQNKTKRDNNLTEHPHRILMLLGALPPGYGKKLSDYLDYDVNKSALHAISKTVLDTSLHLFMKDEVYRKWKRKGNAWRS